MLLVQRVRLTTRLLAWPDDTPSVGGKLDEALAQREEGGGGPLHAERVALPRVGRWRPGSARGGVAPRLPAAAIDVHAGGGAAAGARPAHTGPGTAGVRRHRPPARSTPVPDHRDRRRRAGALDQASLTRAHIVGHDWGGAQAWALGARHPDRVASLTVLSVPHPVAFATSMVTSSQGLRSAYMGFFQLPVLPDALAQLTLRSTLRNTGLPLEYVGRYCDALAEPGALSGALGWYRGIPFSLYPPAGPIRVRTTYVWGKHDFSMGRAAAHRTEAHVQAPYRFVELDAGHWLPEVEPTAVADAVLHRVSSVPG